MVAWTGAIATMSGRLVVFHLTRSEEVRPFVLLPLFCALVFASVFNFSLPSYGQDGSSALSGIWRRDAFRLIPPYMYDDGGFEQGVVDGFKNPILKPWTAEILMEKAYSENNGRIYANVMGTCWPYGVPGIFDVRGIQILQLPDEIKIVYNIDHQSRHIPLNKPHAKPVEPSWYGDSVAHFEGEMLVVDTIGFHAKPQAMVDAYGTPVSEGLHVVERYSVERNGTQLLVHITVEDPNVFKTPWSMTVEYYADDTKLREAPCAENNREWPDLMPIAEKPDF
jgi:hypothetical protein